MSQGTLAPALPPQFFTDSGVPAAGYRIFSYSAGTSTKLATYTDVGLTVANANPIVLDSAGRCTIFLGAGSYKFVFAASGSDDPPNSPIWTRDNVQTIPLITGNVDVAGVAGSLILLAGQAVYLADGTGGTTAGRWYKTDATNTYSSTLPDSIGIVTVPGQSGDSIVVRTGGQVTPISGGMTVGAVYYADTSPGTLTTTAPTNARPILQADTTTTGIITTYLRQPDASTTQAGRVSISTQSFAGLKTFTTPPKFNEGGAATADAIVSGRVSSTYTDVGNVGAGEDNLHTYSLPASALNADGKAVRVTAWGTSANNANGKVVKIYFGATAVATFTLTSAIVGRWQMEMNVVRTGAATQRAVALGFQGASGAGLSTSTIDVATPAETLSGAVTIKCTGTATSDNDIVQSAMIVEVVG